MPEVLYGSCVMKDLLRLSFILIEIVVYLDWDPLSSRKEHPPCFILWTLFRLGTYVDFGRGREKVMHLNNSSLRFSGMTKGLLIL